MSKSCPPCNNKCRQGRDCSARSRFIKPPVNLDTLIQEKNSVIEARRAGLITPYECEQRILALSAPLYESRLVYFLRGLMFWRKS